MNIEERMFEHYKDAQQLINESQIVGLFCQGSQNYGLEHKDSDLDTKLILIPGFKDVCLNKKPVSTTHVRENDEHIDLKDIRLYMDTFRKQNINFLEILFTKYYIINPLYEAQWKLLVDNREAIARLNPYRAVKTMKGHALEKYSHMKRRGISRANVVDKYGYDGKQVSNLIRIGDFLERYIGGEPYNDCLHPSASIKELLMDYKLQRIPLERAEVEAKRYLDFITKIADEYCAQHENKENEDVSELLTNVCYNIIKDYTINELMKEV